MSRLVRLYPAVWRDRYGDEFEALLAERRPTFADVLDTIRGAVDAHVHPQLNGEPESQPWTHRVPGLLALAGGLVFSVGAILAASWRGQGDASSLMGIAAVLMFLSLPGDYMAAHGRRIAFGLGWIALSVIAMRLVSWEAAIALFVVAFVIPVAGMLTLASIRAGVSAGARWIMLALVVALPFVGMIPGLIGFIDYDDAPLAALAVVLPYGLAWVGVGLRMLVRGAQTIVDPPLSPIEPEVTAA